jgi:membrane associated rhomboid family serine protease
MAYRSNTSMPLTLPPFRGVTRRIILIGIACFFASLLLELIAPKTIVFVLEYLALSPALVLRHPWSLLTNAFVLGGLASTLFALLSIWFFAAPLEEERGPHWLTEYFLITVIGGSAVTSLIASTSVLGLRPEGVTAGLWPAALAILLAFARFYPELDILLLIVRVKAKYVVAIYLLVYLAETLVGGDRIGALNAICAALCGFVYLQFVPRRGLTFAASESLYGLRNSYYRAKRQRAAKKFTVYMKKQGKDVNIDSTGRYVDPNGNPRDPNDKRWMN